MIKTDKITENVNAVMAMENMLLTEDNKQTVRRCFNVTESFEKVLSSVILKYSVWKVINVKQ